MCQFVCPLYSEPTRAPEPVALLEALLRLHTLSATLSEVSVDKRSFGSCANMLRTYSFTHAASAAGEARGKGVEGMPCHSQM
jgi:hypothetical protein